jgi:DNA polymerase-1
MPDTVFLIDTFSLMFQVFHAIPPMTSPSGMPTNAVFGFSRDLVSLLQVHKPDWLICALESPGPGVREQLYPEYKAHRSEMPEDLRPQIPLLIDLIRAFHIPVVQSEGWEADDVIATLTRQAVARGLQVRIVTSDKDARQLIGPQVQMYNLRKNTYQDEASLLAEWGVRPDQVVDFQSLVGDAVDNVPGVPLVGPKKAAALLQQFQTLEGVLANADRAPGAKLKENLKTFADQARLSQQLVRLNQTLPVDFDWEASRNPAPDVPALQEMFRKFGFRRLVDDVAKFASKVAEPAVGPATSDTRPPGRSLFDDDVPKSASPATPGMTPPNSGSTRETAGTDSTTRGRDEVTSGSGQQGSENPATNAAPVDPPPGSESRALSSARSAGPPRHWAIVDTPEKFAAFLNQFKTQSRFCLDLETTGLDPRSAQIVGWAICWQAGSAWYLPTLGPAGSSLLDGATVVQTLRPILESPAIRLVNQNVKYDLMVLDSHGIHVPPDCIDVDPMVGDYLLDAGARSHGLETLIVKYLGQTGIPITDLIGSGKNQKNMADIAVNRVAEYATEDADLSLQLADIISAELRGQGLWDLYWDLERPLIPILVEMEQTGIRVDASELRRQSDDLSRRLNELIAEIYAIAGHEFNIDSPKQLQVVLFDELQLPVQRKTKTGASTDQEVLEELAKLHELPAKIIEHRHISKLKGTYLDALPLLVHPRTGRIHTSFNQVVAATGRLSSSDPNLQNIPIRTPEGERIRRAFVASSLGGQDATSTGGQEGLTEVLSRQTSAETPKPDGQEYTSSGASSGRVQRGLFDDDDDDGADVGATSAPATKPLTLSSSQTDPADGDGEWRLVCADYSQIELRVLAHFSQDRELIAAFEQGIDIHTAVAAQVFGVEKESVTGEQRRMAKAVNFGVIYGQSAFGLAAALGIDQDEAAAFIDGYFAKYSGVTQFIEETLSDVERTGFAKTILGRRRAIDGIRPLRNRNLNMPERTAVNTVIQGSAADLIKRAMLAVHRRLDRDRHPGRMLLQIHDELVFEAPLSAVSSLVELARHEMQHAMELTVPLIVDVSVGKNWLDTQPV